MVIMKMIQKCQSTRVERPKHVTGRDDMIKEWEGDVLISYTLFVDI